MTTTTLDLAAQAAELTRVVAAVRDDQLHDPTPCAGTSVAALLDHLHGLSVGMPLAAQKTADDTAPRASAADLPADWRVRIPRELDALVAAWRSRPPGRGRRAPGEWNCRPR